MFIDGYFILEIMINFYTGVWFEGIYHDRYFSLLIFSLQHKSVQQKNQFCAEPVY